jgi:hypothetical protein
MTLRVEMSGTQAVTYTQTCWQVDLGASVGRVYHLDNPDACGKISVEILRKEAHSMTKQVCLTPIFCARVRGGSGVLPCRSAPSA